MLARSTSVRRWVNAVEDVYMFGRWVAVVAAVVGGGLFLWRGPLNGSLGQPVSTPPIQEAGPIISKSGDAMRSLQSLKMTMDGTMVVGGGGSVQITGNGTLTYPHEEDLSFQLRFPNNQPGASDLIVPVYERISKGHIYVRDDPGKPWKDVTGGKGQLAPGMDPLSNLDFAHAFRASDDLGDGVMDGVYVHHFSLNVDPARYIQQLKADPENTLSAADQAELTNAGIQVEVWIAAETSYMHQLKVAMVTQDFRWDVTYRYSDFQAGGGPASAQRQAALRVA